MRSLIHPTASLPIDRDCCSGVEEAHEDCKADGNCSGNERGLDADSKIE